MMYLAFYCPGEEQESNRREPHIAGVVVNEPRMDGYLQFKEIPSSPALQMLHVMGNRHYNRHMRSNVIKRLHRNGELVAVETATGSVYLLQPIA